MDLLKTYEIDSLIIEENIVIMSVTGTRLSGKGDDPSIKAIIPTNYLFRSFPGGGIGLLVNLLV